MRYIKIFTAILVMSTAAFATSNIQLGASSNDFDSKATKGGVYLGIDTTTNLKNGFLLGMGFNINIFKIERKQVIGNNVHTTSGGAYTMSADALVGYTLKDRFNIPLTFKTGIGYGITHDNIINNNSWALIYSGDIVYKIYKSIGIGVRYSTTDTQLLRVDSNLQSTIGYLNIEF